MPKQTSSSNLFKDLEERAQKALEANKTKPIEYDTGGDLPPGIEGGIARLVDCKIDTFKSGDNKGKPRFYAAGVVISPGEFRGQRIEGEQTKVSKYGEPLFDTPTRSRKTFEDHFDWMMNVLALLGLDRSEIENTQDMGPILDALKDQQPYFKFRTWAGTKQTTGPYAGREPQTQEVWKGVINDYEETSEDDGVIDGTVPAEPEEEKIEDEVPFEAGDNTDLDSLAARAADDPDAQSTLQERGNLLGIGDAVESAADWDAVVELIRNAESAEDNAEKLLPTFSELGEKADAGDEDAIDAITKAAEDKGLDVNNEKYDTWTKLAAEIDKSPAELGERIGEPEKGHVFLYRPPRARKDVECEATVVFSSNKTCNLKNLDDGKSYKGVAWGKLKEV